MNVQKPYKLPFEISELFEISSEADFNLKCLGVFHYQLLNNKVYSDYCGHLKVNADTIKHYSEIPFLPISFFKTHQVISGKFDPAAIFKSSGTTGTVQSSHAVKDLTIYEKSFRITFEKEYGEIENTIILGLLPSYLEREGSSLIYMVNDLIKKSNRTESGFFLNEFKELSEVIKAHPNDKIILIGVAYALLDFGEYFDGDATQITIIETGGMKGKRKEMIKTELHTTLKNSFKCNEIHSEYGMTELLSQAYSIGEKFKCPPWMKVLTRGYSDPLTLVSGKTGGLNVIDLANIHSCAFIATADLGRVEKNHFNVLGRFDNSDVRGCNLLVE